MQTLNRKHIEKAVTPFIVEVDHGPYFNVYMHPAETKKYKVMAETAAGAIKIARYHFFISGRGFKLVNGSAQEIGGNQ